MALADLSMLEQRYLAVREVLDTTCPQAQFQTRPGVALQSGFE
jgi:hypothetical protein